MRISRLKLYACFFFVMLMVTATGRGYAQSGAGSFGTIAIGQTSSTQLQTLKFSSSGVLAEQLALTEGARNQDFALASGGSCTIGQSYPADGSCTVAVTFTPRYAGLRRGAIVIVDAAGNALASAYVAGIGSGPQAGFHVTTRQLTTFPDLTLAVDRGIAVDGSGNLFVAAINSGGTGETVVMLSCFTGQACVKQLPGAYSAVRGLAVDGAGNLWVADMGASGSITEILAAGGYSTVKKFSGSFGYPIAITVDGAGNLFFTGGDSGSSGKVTELLASGGYTTAQVLTTGYNTLSGIAVDGSGNVFFSDPSSQTIKQIVAVNGSIPATPTIKSLGSGLRNLSGLALDGGGNLYALGMDASGYGLIFVMPASSGYSMVNELSNQTNPLGIALDARGNLFGVYYTNQALGGITTNAIFELPRSAAPSLVYPTPTAPGEVDSADGPQEVLIESIGSQPLSLAGLKLSSGNFSFDPATSCTASTTLAVGDFCRLAIVFNPLTTGSITGTVTVTDNALNAAAATQSIALSGQSLYTPLVHVALAANVVAVTQALPLTVTVNGGTGNPTPTGTLQITAAGYTPAPLTLSGGSVSTTLPAGTLTPGQATILVTYQPDTAAASNYTTAAEQVTFRVTSTLMNVPTVTVTPAVMSISQGQALSVTVNVAQANGAPMPSGTIVLAGGNYTSPAAALSSGTVTLTIPANQLIIGTDQLIATYTPDADSATIYLTAKGTGFVAVSAAATVAGADPVNFGALGIGKTSAAQAVPLTFPANSTPAMLLAYTQGAAGKDFAIVSGGNCGAGINVAAAQSCTVNVSFTPAFAGLRTGAAVALDADGRILAMTYLQGSGTGAQVSIQSDYYSSYAGVYALNYPASFTTLSDGFSRPGVAVDGAGNLFLADWGSNAVKKIPAGCTSSSCTVTVMRGVWTPTAVAIDGAGNLFVTEAGYGDVKKIPLGCTSSSCMQTIGAGFNQPYGVAVDASGNVFVADTNNNAIKEVVAAGGYSTIKTLASGLNLPWSVVVNASGDLFVAQGGDQCQQWLPGVCSAINTSLLQITAASDYKTVNTLAAGGFGKPFGLAIDGSGNVYVADYGDTCATEFSAGSGYATAHRLCSGNLFIYPEGLAVDGGGNLYLNDVIKGLIYKMDYVTLPAMNFRTATLSGVADVQDGSQVVSVQNNGTAPLTFSAIALSDTSFQFDSSITSCSVSTPLAAGSSCYLAVKFAPTTTGPLSATLTLTDNNLNQSPATQVIHITAVALPPTPVILTNPANPTTNSSATLTFSDTQAPVTFVCSIDSLPFSTCASPATYSTLGGGAHAFQVKAKDSAGNLSLAAVYNWTVNSVGPPAPVITSAPAYLSSENTVAFAFTDSQAGVSYQCSLDGVAFTACQSGVSYTGMSPAVSNTIQIVRHSFAVKAMDASSNFSPETTYAWTATSYQPSAYPVNLGSVAVGQTSSAQSITFHISTAASVATIKAVTMGIPGLDFAVSDPGSCAVGTALSKGSTCTLQATFTPRYSGQRKGAVILLDSASNGIGEAYLQGTGTAPQLTFGPYSTLAYNILEAQNNVDPGKDLVAPVSDVTVDGAGNVYASDWMIASVDQSISVSTGDIWKFPVGCSGPTCSTLVATERNATPSTSAYLILPVGLTMDGAGVLWINNYYSYPQILDTVGTWSPTQCSFIPFFGNNFQRTAVDGAGDATLAGGGVLQNCFQNLGLGQKTQTTSFDFSTTTPSLTVDPQGNFFVADADNNAVKEVLASSKYTISRTVGSGFNHPASVASDALGNIYVADTGNNALKEITAASGYTEVLTLATFDPKVTSLGNLTVDERGNVYIVGSIVYQLGANSSQTSQFLKLDFASPPSLNFPTATKIGTTDTTDGTLTATVKNSGNQPLTISGLTLSNTNFSIDARATTCSTSAPLAVGSSCTLGVLFTPNATGALTATLTLTDNALNASGATQQFALSGTGFLTPTAVTPTVTVLPASASITAAQSDVVTITVSGPAGRATPTGTVSLFGGNYTSATVSLSAGSATFTLPAGILAVGSTTLNAIYTPDAASSSVYGTGAGSANISVTAVSASTPTVTVMPALINVSTQQSLLVDISVSGGNGSPTPSGAVTLSGGNFASLATILINGSATITIPSGYLPAGTVPLTAYYTPDRAGQANYTSASGSAQVAVGAAAKTTPALTVTPAALSISSKQSLLVTLQVSGGSGRSTPTGTVTLSNGSVVISTAVLSQGSAIVSLPAGTLPLGSDTLTASYTPDLASSLSYNSATGSGLVTVASVPAASLAPASLSFTAVSGTTSAGQTLTLANTGDAVLNLAGISIAGTGASAFAQSNACGSTLAVDSRCTITVTFTPASVASFSATLSVADNTADSPHVVPLSGTGSPAPSFTLSSTTAAQSLAPGSTATYTITVTPQNGAFNSAVTFSVSGLPTGAAATFSPATITPGSTPATTQLSIQTSTAIAQRHGSLFWPAASPALALIGFLCVPRRRRRPWLVLSLLLVASLGALIVSGCGGGFARPSTAQTYTLTVVGTGNNLQQSTTVLLTVE